MRTAVVVPTLGQRPVYLADCLRSITSQGIDSLDLILVGPSGRGLEKTASEFHARYVREPDGGGQSAALNAGLRAVVPGTSYFAWLCDDDLLRPGSLSAAISVLEARSDATMAFGWCDYIDDEGAVVFRSRAGRFADLVLKWGPNLIPQPGSLMRYDSVLAVGGVDETCRLTMDLDLFLRLRERGPLVAIPQTLAAFRWHADSLTVSGEEASMTEADQVRMRYMSRAGARVYQHLRWPGRWALKAVKRRVHRNVRRSSARRERRTP